MRKHIGIIIAGILAALILAFSFIGGEDAAEIRTEAPPAVNTEESAAEKSMQAPARLLPSVSADDAEGEEKPEEPARADEKKEPVPSLEENADKTQKNDKRAGEQRWQTEPSSENALTCTLSVRCDTVLSNIARLDEEKLSLIPEDGVIYAEKTVALNAGESVFDLLAREMKNGKIHMEFENTPAYNSAYIEGIGNLYEFDCGELSGWMYKVNGVFPNYGCSRYFPKDGDRIEWVYTCDLGADIGGNNGARNGG